MLTEVVVAKTVLVVLMTTMLLQYSDLIIPNEGVVLSGKEQDAKKPPKGIGLVLLLQILLDLLHKREQDKPGVVASLGVHHPETAVKVVKLHQLLPHLQMNIELICTITISLFSIHYIDGIHISH